jgi:isopentenyldiphosphate isomerase
MRRRRAVTCFLQYEGRILLLRRSSTVRTYRGMWAGVSGSIESSTPLGQAIREIQ